MFQDIADHETMLIAFQHFVIHPWKIPENFLRQTFESIDFLEAREMTMFHVLMFFVLTALLIIIGITALIAGVHFAPVLIASLSIWVGCLIYGSLAHFLLDFIIELDEERVKQKIDKSIVKGELLNSLQNITAFMKQISSFNIALIQSNQPVTTSAVSIEVSEED